jgi:putative ABC transport system permease protein
MSEVALATMLLIGAAIAARSTVRMLQMDRNFDPHNVLTAQLWMPPSRYPTAAAQRRFLDQVLDRVRALPGVESASMVNYPPLGILGTGVDFEIEEQAVPAPGEALLARFQVIDTDYFRTLRLPLIAGRAFETSDAEESRGVTIVSETFARRFFGGRDAIGQRIRPRFPGGDAYWYPSSTNQPLRIVGIARDIREDGIKDGEPPQMYLPYTQNPSRIMHLLVCTQGSPLEWAAAVRHAILEMDRDEPIFDVKTLEKITEQSFARESAFESMLRAAGGLATLLAATGIYALLAWSVSRRRREIGIRIAIGATQSHVARAVLRQALQPTLAGIAVGICGALALNSILKTLVIGADRFDAVAFALPAAMLALVSVAACLAPLVGAIRVDPVTTLQME